MKRTINSLLTAVVIISVMLLSLWIDTFVVFAQTTDEKNNIEIYQSAAPGVVNILSVVITRDFFFYPVPQEGAGSGVIVDDRGYILTNNHVIKDATRLEVTLFNGDKLKAKLVGADPANDLAVIKIESQGRKLTAIPMAESQNLQVGQKVLAIGNPFGLGETLTTGIISSLGRTIKSRSGMEIEDVIQTDASINPGNSGGPLLNSDGKIIGINTAILSPTGANVGIGFAIPVKIAQRILPELIQKGYVSYPWLGVQIFPIIPGIAEVLDLKINRGAMIVDVIQGGPAEKAGIRGASRKIRAGNMIIPVGGDIVVAFDGKKVTSSEELIKYLREEEPGDVVELKILRNHQFKRINVKLGERPQR